MDKTSLGDRMKMYERKRDERFIPLIPIIARLDGRSFHTFCRGLDRPFDANMSNAMLSAAKYVFEESGANIAYTQSDEISLLFHTDKVGSQLYFDGRVQKMVSNLTADVVSEFLIHALHFWPGKAIKQRPKFDCRVWQLPYEEVHNYFRWRVRDALKNSVSMAASAYYSHKELLGKNGAERQDMLRDKGVNWGTDYPQHWKEGTFMQKRVLNVAVPDERMRDIPEKYRAHAVGKRRETVYVEDFPGDGFETTTNMNGFLFNSEPPATTFPLGISAEANHLLQELFGRDEP